MKRLCELFAFCALSLILTGCFEDELREMPTPVALSIEHDGYFCSMTIADHPGPKAQIHVAGQAAPLWFAQVRDMFGFIMLPGESREITALYVTDMSANTSWDNTNDGPWIDPKNAWFVINSKRIGGMGALEVVPFSVKADAMIFAQEFGGQVLTYSEVPSDYIFDTSMNLSRTDSNPDSDGSITN